MRFIFLPAILANRLANKYIMAGYSACSNPGEVFVSTPRLSPVEWGWRTPDTELRLHRVTMPHIWGAADSVPRRVHFPVPACGELMLRHYLHIRTRTSIATTPAIVTLHTATPPSHFIKRYDLKHQNQNACLQNYNKTCFSALSEYCVLWQNGTICVFGDWRRNLSCLITQRSGIMKFMSSWLLECKYIQHNSHWL